jgi:hypothetical protein
MRVPILRSGVRTASLLLLVVAALVAPSVVLAERTAKGDGTLSVRGGYGWVGLSLNRGIVFGRVASGRISFGTDGDFEDFGTCDTPPTLKEDTFTCRGSDLRFRFTTSTLDEIRVSGKEINVTAVGQGTGKIKGNIDALDVGSYSLNGGVYADLPLFDWKKFTLAAPTALGG